MKTEPTSHAAPWTPARRAADWAFRYVIPGRHYSFTNSLLALMLARETAP